MSRVDIMEIERQITQVRIESAKLGKNIINLIEQKDAKPPRDQINFEFLLKAVAEEHMLLVEVMSGHMRLLKSIQSLSCLIQEQIIDNPNIEAQLAEIFGGR